MDSAVSKVCALVTWLAVYKYIYTYCGLAWILYFRFSAIIKLKLKKLNFDESRQYLWLFISMVAVVEMVV